MEVNPAVWHLKKRRCECCTGQGALCFFTCRGCGHIALVCDEVGTVFLDPKNTQVAVYGGMDDPSCRCSACSSVHISDFRPSTAEEIQKLGFAVGDYA